MRGQDMSGNKRSTAGVLTLVGKRSYAQGSTPLAVTWPVGTQAGDLVVIFASRRSGGAPILSATVGTTTVLRTTSWSGNWTNVWSVRLDAADIAAPPTIDQDIFQIVAIFTYRNAASATYKARASTSAGSPGPLTNSIPGFTPKSGARVLLHSVDFDRGTPGDLPSNFAPYTYTTTAYGVVETTRYAGGNIDLTNMDATAVTCGGEVFEVA